MAIKKPSEFGGFGGLVQPEPHELTAAEKLVEMHHRSVPSNPDVDPEEERFKEQTDNGWKGEDSL